MSEELDKQKLLMLKRINRLQHQILELNPNILSERNIKNLRATVEKLDNNLDELVSLIESLLDGEDKWQNKGNMQG